MSSPGELVLVATPIGNLGDLSPRAIEVLARADAICCEDTRHSGQLLSRAGVSPRRLISLHAHNEAARLGEVLGLLRDGKTVAVVTDAGLPAVSDPGGRLVDAAHEAGARLSVVPGPSAAPAALALSGFTAGRWCFEGFLPIKPSERRERLAAISASQVPSVIYESPRRVDRLLAELAELAGPVRKVLVCRELTKLHEEVWRGSLSEAAGRWPEQNARGEFALVLEGRGEEEQPEMAPDEVAALVLSLVAGGLSRRDAVDEAAGRTRSSRRAVYEALEQARKGSSKPL